MINICKVLTRIEWVKRLETKFEADPSKKDFKKATENTILLDQVLLTDKVYLRRKETLKLRGRIVLTHQLHQDIFADSALFLALHSVLKI
jgi:hypothetical protein